VGEADYGTPVHGAWNRHSATPSFPAPFATLAAPVRSHEVGTPVFQKRFLEFP
jgi:hypothetical protein